MEAANVVTGLDYLPVALWMHILSSLPVKSLLVVRAVCKYFLAMIDNSYFVTLHLRNYPANLHETRILTLRPSNEPNDYETFVFSSVCEILEIQGTTEVNAGSSLSKWLEELPCFNTDHELSIVGSVDGLVLATLWEVATLWNPSIKKSRQIPSPSDSISVFDYISLGLGYDVSCNDYKVLAIIDPALNSRTLIEELKGATGAWVYSVKTGSWATIGMPACRDKRKMSERLSFKGGLVWIEGVKSVRGYYHHLVWFDFATEKFRYTWMPYPIKNNMWLPNRLVMLDGGSSMGVLGLDYDNMVSIWAVDESGMSWIRLYKIGESVFRMGAFRKSEMIWECWTKGARPKVSLYDDKEDGYYRSSYAVSYMGAYVESLALLN